MYYVLYLIEILLVFALVFKQLVSVRRVSLNVIHLVANKITLGKLMHFTMISVKLIVVHLRRA